MSKLFKLKEWLTLADAARHLSIVFGEDVSEADLLQLALDRRLDLSVYFPSYEPAVIHESINSPTIKSIILHGLYDMPVPPEPTAQTEYDICDNRLHIENRYHKLMSAPIVDFIDMPMGVMVCQSNGAAYTLVERMMEDDPRLKFAPYYVCDDLPKSAVLAVRTAALRELERGSNDAPVPTSRDHVSDKLAKVNQAAAQFWAKADRNDRTTHHTNNEVAAWLSERGLSPSLASSAASIIRPEWAPTGRKPIE